MELKAEQIWNENYKTSQAKDKSFQFISLTYLETYASQYKQKRNHAKNPIFSPLYPSISSKIVLYK